jgi:hypothetical protein
LSVQTAVLPDVEPITCTWELDVDRCALEVSYGLLGMTVWRARLRPVEGRIVSSESGDGPVTISGVVAVRPSYVSLPGTRGWFLRRAARRDLIHIDGTAGGDGGGIQVTVGARQWTVDLLIRRTPVEDGRAVVAAIGAVVPRPDTPVPAAHTRIELAAEFLRCG